MKSEARAPLIVAIVLLVLPVLYVGSYCALVVPGGTFGLPDNSDPYNYENWLPKNYRFGNSFCRRFFWPLEQIDRKLRPGAWEDPLLKMITPSLFPSFPPSRLGPLNRPSPT